VSISIPAQDARLAARILTVLVRALHRFAIWLRKARLRLCLPQPGRALAWRLRSLVGCDPGPLSSWLVSGGAHVRVASGRGGRGGRAGRGPASTWTRVARTL